MNGKSYATPEAFRAGLESQAKKLRDDMALVTSIYPPFDQGEYMEGLVTPVFFGSALNNFGVRELLDNLVRLAPYPAVSPGHPLAIAVRMDALHFFDGRGDRIDVGWR